MTAALIDHLWQSTLFAVAAAALTLAFRNNGANVRFQVWLAASVKFLIPFPLLIALGSYMRWETAPTLHAAPAWSLVLDQIVRPSEMVTTSTATTSSPGVSSHWSIWTIVFAVWAVGFVGLIGRWVFQWIRMRAVLKASTQLDIKAPIPVRQTATALEPGIFGIVRPVLLLPQGMSSNLAQEQFDTILAHELCHLRRRDNLTAAIHMLVEALFWFHPLVWWLGYRMIVERERACDEAVIQSGSDRQIYAEGILNVCRLYVEPPLLCTAGVSGGTLRKRIEEIMIKQVLDRIHFAKKCILSLAASLAIVGLLTVGLVTGPNALVQAQAPTSKQGNMRHYKSSEWNFELDVPSEWNTFPPVPANSPYEVIRFASSENGNHLLIVFRNPYDTSKLTPKAMVELVQQTLATGGFANFVTGETTLGSRQAYTLDFDKTMPNGDTWSCRHYFVINGSLVYILGFGTNRHDDKFGVFDQIAKTLVLETATG